MRDLSLHLMDIARNSVKAKASIIVIDIFTDKNDSLLHMGITDNGCGMDADALRHARDPFYTSRTTRKVGFGIPMFEESSNIAGGTLTLKSEKNKGTYIEGTFEVNHIDRLPLGDIGETISTLILGDPLIQYKLNLANSKEHFSFDTCEISGVLGDVSITSLDVIEWIKEYINQNINIIFGGILSEIIS